MMDSQLFAGIRAKYSEMTSVERVIADYFLAFPSADGLSPGQVAETLFVSKASLSRFAQKLGLPGFREFLYQYKADCDMRRREEAMHPSDRKVFEDYAFILQESKSSIDGRILEKAAGFIRRSSRIIIYGDGLSGYAAGEFMTRFKRLGFPVESYTNDFMMQTNSAIIRPGTLVIGISLSGSTQNTMQGLKKARQNGARTLLITAQRQKKYNFDAVLYVGSLPNLSAGMIISPQIPVLIMIDLLFNRIVGMDPDTYMSNYHDTCRALEHNQNKGGS